MKLEPDQTLSHYRLIEQIGEGGMGVVWKASDTTLDRQVAIKILPVALAQDHDRLARFEREAKLLASLNHPNIATIHGLHEDHGVRFLAMELLDGNDLTDVVACGPLPLDETLNIARHIAIALEEAHRNGVIHRDLKPDNVRVSDSKQVKVLDFGLARRQELTPAAGPDSDTVTQPGYIVGTVPYMSPEQVRGKSVTKQTDIWAFGCVLYEMLTGQRAFVGDTPSDRMAAVLRSDPNYDDLPATTPGALIRLLRRCLEKEPSNRWHDIGDVRIELDELATGRNDEHAKPLGAIAKAEKRFGGRFVRLAPWLIALAALACALIVWQRSLVAPASDRPRLRTTIEPAEGVTFDKHYATVAVPSPDGTRVVYVGNSAGKRQLWLRPLDELESQALPGTEGGWEPFFSPDGRWVGFFAERKLKKVPLSGGPAETIVEVGGNPRGASWGTDGWIVVAPTQTSGLIRVHAEDGEIEPLTELDLVAGESTHRWPQVLPARRGVLFTARAEGTSFDQANIVVATNDGQDPQVIIEGGAHGRYIHSGHIAFVRGGRLLVVRFDLNGMKVTSDPVRVVDGVAYSHRNGGAQFAVSENGTFVYRPGAALSSESVPMWVDRTGETERIDNTQRNYSHPRLSPDGQRLLVSIFGGQASTLWSLDLAGGTFSQITRRESVGGRWVGPRSQSIVYAAGAPRQLGLFLRAVDGLGAARALTTPQHRQEPCTVSPDGRMLIFQERRPDTSWDLMLLTLDEDGAPVGEPAPLLATPANEAQAHFSRDGKFLAYESDELDAVVQIYVRSFPSMDGKRQLSDSGARQPRFSPSRDELFYWSTGSRQLRAVKYGIDGATLVPEPAIALLEELDFSVSSGGDGGVLADPSFMGFDIHRQSDRFVMLELEKAITPDHAGDVVLVLDWFSELRGKP